MAAWIAIALCLLPLMEQVQVLPVPSATEKPPSLHIKDLNLDYLLTIVTCGNNITFTSPTNMEVKCHKEALRVFINEFQKVFNQCQGDTDSIGQTIEVLEMAGPKNQTECTLTTKVHHNFPDFAEATKEFAQKVYSKSTK